MADGTAHSEHGYSGKQPWLLGFRSSKGFIASTVFAATFTDGFAYGIVVPVMPFALIDRSGVAPDQVDFWNSAFLVAFGLAQILASPFIGWWTDRSTSRRAPFLTGLVLIFAASLILCFAIRPWVMMIARAIAGFSAGIVFCTGLTLVVDSVPRKEIGEWMGFALSGMTWGTMMGPTLGGIIYKRAGYYAVFLTLLAVIVYDFLLRAVMIEKGEASKWRNQGRAIPKAQNNSDDTADHTVQSRRDSFTRHESVSKSERKSMRNKLGNGNLQKATDERQPLLDSHKEHQLWYQRRFPGLTALLRSRRLIAAVLGTFVYNALIASFDDILSLFANRTFGWDSEYTGLLYLAIPIPTLTSPFVGMLADRYGARIVALFGFGLTTPCLALLGLVRKDSTEQIVLLVAFLLLTGLGLNFIVGPLAGDMSFVVEGLTTEQPELFGQAGAYAQAYSFFAAAMAAGVMFGPAVAGVLYKNVNWQVTMGVLAAFCALGSVQVYRFSGGPPSKSGQHEDQSAEA